MATKQKSKTVSKEESITLVRNLMRTAISTICYLRGIFPEDCFTDRTVSGIHIKSIAPVNNETNLIVDWLEQGVFDAIRLQYLKVLSFGFYTDRDEKSIIESYEFKVTYPEGNANVDIARKDQDGKVVEQSKSEITASMQAMLRTLITLAQTLKPLPDSKFITMKLLYYDDVTPIDYQPKYFMEVDEHAKGEFVQRNLVKLQLGAVQTRFHTLGVRIAAHPDWFEEDSQDAESLEGVDKQTTHEVDDDPDVEIINKGASQPEIRKNAGSPQEFRNASGEVPMATQDGDTSRERRIDRILRATQPSEHDILYLRGLIHVMATESVAPSKLGKKVGIEGYQVKDLLDELQVDGFMRPTPNKRGRVPAFTEHNRDTLKDLLSASFVPNLLSDGEVDQLRNLIGADRPEAAHAQKIEGVGHKRKFALTRVPTTPEPKHLHLSTVRSPLHQRSRT
mmetsp:Transcript_27702/g.44248  ORF Transcript_27702/g.44248 Transcript_27702/m.44248 type:complete len:450 (+) Transcript_27702:42-1391(+)